MNYFYIQNIVFMLILGTWISRSFTRSRRVASIYLQCTCHGFLPPTVTIWLETAHCTSGLSLFNTFKPLAAASTLSVWIKITLYKLRKKIGFIKGTCFYLVLEFFYSKFDAKKGIFSMKIILIYLNIDIY